MSKVVKPSKDPEETALQFKCNLLDAGRICDILRNQDRLAGDYPTRVYVQPVGGVWRRLSDSSVLTEVVEDKRVLSPAVFPNEFFVVPTTTKVSLGFSDEEGV